MQLISILMASISAVTAVVVLNAVPTDRKSRPEFHGAVVVGFLHADGIDLGDHPVARDITEELGFDGAGHEQSLNFLPVRLSPILGVGTGV